LEAIGPGNKYEDSVRQPQTAAVLWFVGGLAFVVVWLISDPRRGFSLVAGLLVFVVGIVTLIRGRRMPPPPAL